MFYTQINVRTFLLIFQELFSSFYEFVFYYFDHTEIKYFDLMAYDFEKEKMKSVTLKQEEKGTFIPGLKMWGMVVNSDGLTILFEGTDNILDMCLFEWNDKSPTVVDYNLTLHTERGSFF